MRSTDFVQGDLFGDERAAGAGDRQTLEMADADVVWFPQFFSREESDDLFRRLYDEVEWRQDRMKIYGKEVDLPRKTAWYGDRQKSYTFSRIHLEPEPWTETLLEVKRRVEGVARVEFNSVLLNLYRDGRDSISWHSDAESELGENPVIGSVSFGGERRFMFRHRERQEKPAEVVLTHGSLLVMAGRTQHCWQHQIPKTSRRVEPRINLTFRVIVG
jgi:alkylated DNA repair dioxygenase AlkB